LIVNKERKKKKFVVASRHLQLGYSWQDVTRRLWIPFVSTLSHMGQINIEDGMKYLTLDIWHQFAIKQVVTALIQKMKEYYKFTH
jgi:hypothetical protein